MTARLNWDRAAAQEAVRRGRAAEREAAERTRREVAESRERAARRAPITNDQLRLLAELRREAGLPERPLTGLSQAKASEQIARFLARKEAS